MAGAARQRRAPAHKRVLSVRRARHAVMRMHEWQLYNGKRCDCAVHLHTNEAREPCSDAYACVLCRAPAHKRVRSARCLSHAVMRIHA